MAQIYPEDGAMIKHKSFSVSGLHEQRTLPQAARSFPFPE